MRIQRIAVKNIAPLPDGEVVLPGLARVGLAGANGTGKSTLLVALLAPWTRNLPPSRDEAGPAEVSVSLSLSMRERAEMAAYGKESSRGNEPIREVEVVTVARQPRAGLRPPSGNWTLLESLQSLEFLASVPSLDVVYIPAERRFARQSRAELNLDVLSTSRRLERMRNARAQAFSEAGRLDEQEFEEWAKAACVAAALDPSRGETWQVLKSAVDTLLAPKKLAGMTGAEPYLSIELPNGERHPLGRLSSGELQALIVLGSLLRAGASGSVALIDEPDLHLHPGLGSQMFQALRQLATSQLLVASHSPFLLDAMSTDSIVELRLGQPPRVLASERERIEAYRRLGFRSADIVQAPFVVVVEGSTDIELLRALDTRLARAAFHAAGGRPQVLSAVRDLVQHDLSVIGVVDGDVEPPNIAADIRDRVVVWPTADIEGLLLSSDHVLEAWISSGYAKDQKATLGQLRASIDTMGRSRYPAALADLTKVRLARDVPNQFPNSDGPDPMKDLRLMWDALHKPREHNQIFDREVANARQILADAKDPFLLVHGKDIVDQVTRDLTGFRTPRELLLASVASPAGREVLAPLVEMIDRVAPQPESTDEVIPSVTASVTVGDELHIENRQSLECLATTADLDMSDVSRALAGMLEATASAISVSGAVATGPPFLRYLEYGAQTSSVRIGQPVRNLRMIPDKFDVYRLPQREVAVAQHHESYADVSNTYRRLQEWMAARGHESDESSWEEFLTYPSAGAAANAGWRIRVVQPIGLFADGRRR